MQFHIHLHTFLRHQIVQRSLIDGTLLVGDDGLVDATQQIEGLLVIVLFVIHCRGLYTTLHALLGLTLVGIVLEGTDKVETGTGDVAFLTVGLSTLLKLAFLRFLCTDDAAAEEHTQK